MQNIAKIRNQLNDLLRRTDHPLGLVFYIVMGVSVSVVWLFVLPEPGPGALHRNTEVATPYLQIVGFVYAIILGFAVFVVWSEFNDAQRNVELEGDALWGFLRIIGGFPDETNRGLLQCLLNHAQAIAVEWKLMNTGGEIESRSESLEKLWSPLSQVNVTTLREQALYAEALQRFTVIDDTRSFRLLHNKPRIPASLWTLILCMGVITVGSMYFFGLEHAGAHQLMIGVMAGSITFILFLIFDLDRRFSGIWMVKSDQIDQIVARICSLLDLRSSPGGKGAA